MGYDIDTPVKQVWLPLDYGWIRETIGSSLTLSEFNAKYKEKYGIEIADFIRLKDDDGYIYIVGDVRTYCQDDRYIKRGYVTKEPVFIVAGWASGESDARTSLLVCVKGGTGVAESAFGVQFAIYKDREFKKENITVLATEL